MVIKNITIKNVSEILNYLESHSWKETSVKYNISEMSISRLKKRYKVVKNELIANNKGNMINKLFINFIKDLKSKPLGKWSSAELRFFYRIIAGKSASLTTKQYRAKIRGFLNAFKEI